MGSSTVPQPPCGSPVACTIDGAGVHLFVRALARLKARVRPMRGLKRDRSAQVIVSGHALVQNFRRGHYELGTYALPHLRLAAAIDELTRVV